MTLPRFFPRQGPLLLFLGLTFAAFAAGALVPYRLDSDTAFQLESVRQWLHGDVPSPGFLRVPDTADLSRDRLVWSTWWPPGFPFLYSVLPATGLPFGAALRLTSLVLFLIGSLGWLRLADRIELPRWLRFLYAASLAGYGFTIGGAASLRAADVLAYTAGPWLAALVLHTGLPSLRDRGEGVVEGAWVSDAVGLFLCGLALGFTYWLRYSLFLIALPLLAWAAFHAVRGAGRRTAGLRPGRLAALGIGFLLPVATLFGLNLHLSKNLAESATGTRSASPTEDTVSGRPLPLAVSTLGAPGLGLFQTDLWVHHLLYFSDARLPFFRGMSDPDRLLLKSLFGIIPTLALVLGLRRGRRLSPGPQADLAAVLPVGFYLALLAVSLAVGYNYLAHETRFAAGFLPLAQPLVLAGWLSPGAERRRRPGGVLLAAAFCVLPLLFAAAVFVKNDVGQRLAAHCAPDEAGLYTPELACRDLPAVEQAVAAALPSPRDVVVLAGPRGWGSSFVMWLEVQHRVLPVSTWVAPLGSGYIEDANLQSRHLFTTSRPLRVLVVADRGFAADGTLAGLLARFPQARGCHSTPVPDGAAVVLSLCDLK
ncbi:MAG TPA: hypothetical protein VH988_01300 [Thermoanaerobaculia bacterium]|jgi:hypothetical protein|nr:hypothetical protein [Thermoanaerobaculia bacterium]